MKLQSIATLFLGIILFSSCSDENDIDTAGNNGELTADEASNRLNSMSGDMHTDLVEMVNSDGADALTDLVDLLAGDDIFAGRIDTDASSPYMIKRRLKAIKRIFIPSSVAMSSNDDRFDFVNSLGVYNYNLETKMFDKAEDVVDHIQINFPSEGSTTNNATLRILEYSDVLIEKEFDQEYLPTLIVADLTLDQTLVVSLGFAANFSSTGLPETADIALYVIPFDYELIFKNTDALASSASFSISKDSESIIGATVEVVFKAETKEVLKSLSGEISYRTYALKGDVDVESIENADDSGTIDINDFINIALYDGGNKIGDVVIEETADGEEAYIVFADGTKKLLETVLQPVIDEMEDFIMQLEGAS